jgi:hypothetical protein
MPWIVFLVAEIAHGGIMYRRSVAGNATRETDVLNSINHHGFNH